VNVKVEMRNSHDLWNALSPLELASSTKIVEMLKPFVQPITDCYECGVEVPTLPCKHETTKDIGVAALFLKRSLNDWGHLESASTGLYVSSWVSGGGDVSFTASFPTTVPSDQYITSTATDSDNNTSEFSQCVQVAGAPMVPTMPIWGGIAMAGILGILVVYMVRRKQTA